MNHHLIVHKLKKIMMCTRRRPQVEPSPATQATSTESESCGGTTESVRCQPRFTRSELRRREQLELEPRMSCALSGTHPSQLPHLPEESESVRTLSSGSLDIQDREALIAVLTNGDWQVTCTADFTGTLSERRVFRQSLDYQAEICQLTQASDRCSNVRDSAKDAYTLARADDLVIAEYPQESIRTENRKPKVLNNVPISFQRHLNMELCEVNQSRSPSAYPSETVLVTTNLSNVALVRPCSCHTSHPNACRRSPLQVQVMSDESEPRTTCASASASHALSYEPLSIGCWPDDEAKDAAAPVRAPPAAAAGDAASAGNEQCDDDAEAKCCWVPTDAERDALAQQAGYSLRHSSVSCEEPTCGDEPCQHANPCRLGDTHPSLSSSDAASNRFGALSADWCNNLCQSLVSGGGRRHLLQQYLAKRGIDEASREQHRQRCGRITAELAEKILRLPPGTPASTCRSQPLAEAKAVAAAAGAVLNPEPRKVHKWPPTPTVGSHGQLEAASRNKP